MGRSYFDKILIANRGEIAVRVMRTARKMGISTVAVYSDADRGAMHVRYADEAVHIGAAAASDSYLNIDKILQAAKDTGAQAIHPGYGFLSENAGFARACKEAGIVFIGPSAEAIEAMGLKDKAKDLMVKAGVPVVPGYQGTQQDAAFLAKQADEIGYPVLIKAVAGGGGKGMRKVDSAADFAESLASCKREAQSAFGNDHVLVEKFIEKPRHIEVQVFGDNYGEAVYLFERDCSLQRRHQKVVEEAPAPQMTETMRAAMGKAAVNAARAIGYSGAGTIEFIVDASGGKLSEDGFYFMEMNTRLQVEHPVTEMITGQDLVEWQIKVAAGEALPCAQDDLSINGHAVEVRLYAEDAAHNFLPQTGRLTRFSCDVDDDDVDAQSIRFESGVESGDSISIYYDPMVAKLVTHGQNRGQALGKMGKILGKLRVIGLKTNQEFLSRIIAHHAFESADLDTGFIEKYNADLLPSDYGQLDTEALVFLVSRLYYSHLEKGEPWLSERYWRQGGESVYARFECADHSGAPLAFDVELFPDHFICEGGGLNVSAKPRCSYNKVFRNGQDITIFDGMKVIHLRLKDYGEAALDAKGAGRVIAPMPGRIIDLLVAKAQEVEKGQPLLVMEAMKMEVTIRAECSGLIDELPIAAGDQVEDGALLVSIAAEEDVTGGQ